MKIDGVILVSVKRWKPPTWIEKQPFRWLSSNSHFLKTIRRLGSYGEEERFGSADLLDLITNSGLDWIHGQVYTNTNSTQASQGACVLAVASGTTAPNATDTVLSGELTTSDMKRKQAMTITHAAGSSTVSLVATWTATASRTVTKGAVFNATSAGTLVQEATNASQAMNTNDVYQLTFNGTLG